MTKLGKKIAICIVSLFAFIASVCAILAPNFNRVEAAPSYTVKETAFMAYIDDCSQANGNFYLIVTMSELDTETVAEGVAYDTSTDDMPTMFRNFDFFNKVKINGYTLAELGCTSVWENAFDVNAGGGAPMYKLRFHMHADPTTWQNAISAGKVVFGVGSNVTISEGTLIPGYAYLTGDHSATVYRAGCDFVSSAAGVDYGVMSVGKTDVLSLDYVTNWDSTYNNAYLGFSLKGDDYLGNGSQLEVNQNYTNNVYEPNRFDNKILINGSLSAGSYATVTQQYGLFNLGTKGNGMFACTVRKPEAEVQSITIPKGTLFPSRAMTDLPSKNPITTDNGSIVYPVIYIMYETQNDVTFTKSPYTGRWVAEINEIDATVEAAQIFGEGDCFAGIKVANNDYPEQDTWNGGLIDAKIYAHSENFTSHVLFDDVPLAEKSETFLNVWRNFGYFTFRPGAGATASKITILAGCRIPTYNGLLNGIEEVYVISQDATFVKDGSGNWVYKENVLEAGEYNTSISAISYARDNASNQMLITLSQKDYPKANEVFNLGLDVNKTANLNLYDKIIIDGRTLRSRIAEYANGDLNSVNPTINKWQADCFGIKIPGAAGALDGAQKITIRAGAQFPSYAWATQNVEAYFVTTEEITFVNVGADNGAWARQYKATFVADGEVVATVPYLQGEAITAPEVPEKDGYRGAWESYTANGDITVNAVYTANPTSLGLTGIKKLRRIENTYNILIIEPTNSDYPASVEGSWNIGLDVSHLSKFNLFDYITINGKTLREIGVVSTAINKFTRPGLGLETVLSDQMTIVIKKGCEIPSYAFWKNPNTEYSCYLVDADYTCIFDKSEEKAEDIAFSINKSNSDTVDEDYNTFNDHYILSDLNAPGYFKTDCFKDGIEYLPPDNTLEGYRYGHVDSTSFTVSLDFTFTGASHLETMEINFGTEGISENHGNIESHFGWRIYLVRVNGDVVVPNFCVEYYSSSSSYKGNITNSANEVLGNSAFVEGRVYNLTIGYRLDDASTGKVTVYTAINGLSRINTYTLGGDFPKFAPYIDTFIFKSKTAGNLTIGDPGKDLSKTETNGVTFEGANIESVYTDKVVLPALDPVANAKLGNVFIGWTTDPEGYTTLYPAGYEMTLEENVKLYPVWIDFNVAYGASVRKDETTRGIRFSAKVDKGIFDAGRQLGLISEVGMIVAPTSYLAKKDLTHDLGAGYYSQWATTELLGNVFHVALVNISPDQYAREFSARGYLKVNYTTGEVGYVYTDYNKNANSRSIYQVAKSASQAGETDSTGTLTAYVNAVADITVDTAYNVKVNGTDHNNIVVNGHTVTITLNSPVKAVVVNGVRLVMGYDANVKVSGMKYGVSGYKLSASGTVVTLTFTPHEDVIDKDQLIEELQKYIDSTEYTAEHHTVVKGLAQTAINEINGANASEYLNIFNDAIAEIKTVKTATELANNATSKVTLDAPVVSRGLGYAVTWNAVENAEYYTVQDNNDYRDRVVVLSTETLTYKAEVIGNHSITVTAHSYYRSYNSSAISNVVTTPEVKPVFSYKSMLDGLYKFSSSQMDTMELEVEEIGRDANNKPIYNYYLDTSDKKYFAYYNKDTGWSTYATAATDWTSPEELPAHLDRLKAMGNNVVLVARDTKAEFKANDVWATSRLKYVMDTAWSKGMKVLVCDEVLYQFSMSDPDDLGSKDVNEIKTAIENDKERGFIHYVTHPAFYGFSLDDEPYVDYMDYVQATITAIDAKCEELGVRDPFYLACLFQYQGGNYIELSTKNKVKNYWLDWLSTPGVDNYLYVDIYTQHAMGQLTDRYNDSFDVVYNSSYLGGKYKFHQAITAHTQNNGTLLEQDLYMSLLYAAAHNVAGYSWFCYFPISGETSGSMVGYDGNGYGNGIVNNASGSYYNAAKTAGYQFELIQGWLDGYSWATRGLSNNSNLLTTTLKKDLNSETEIPVTCYVNADVNSMSATVSVSANVNGCNTYYKIGHGIATYEDVTKGTSVSLAPGQALICLPA